MSKVYHVFRPHPVPPYQLDADCTLEAVVVAHNELQARHLLKESPGQEGAQAWDEGARVTVKQLGIVPVAGDREPRIVTRTRGSDWLMIDQGGTSHPAHGGGSRARACAGYPSRVRRTPGWAARRRGASPSPRDLRVLGGPCRFSCASAIRASGRWIPRRPATSTPTAAASADPLTRSRTAASSTR